MSDTEVEVLNERITAHLDARLRKVVFALWTMILGALGSLIFIGISWGQVTARVEIHQKDHNLHMTMVKQYDAFVTRSEWVAMEAQRDKSIVEMKEALRRLEDKIDKKL